MWGLHPFSLTLPMYLFYSVAPELCSFQWKNCVCVCTYAGMWCVYLCVWLEAQTCQSGHVETRANLSKSLASTSFEPVLLLIPTHSKLSGPHAYVSLAGPWFSRDFSVSTSHLALGMLVSHICANIFDFMGFWRSEHDCVASALPTKPPFMPIGCIFYNKLVISSTGLFWVLGTIPRNYGT